jgi:agmatine/peptidylarginine deiminase
MIKKSTLALISLFSALSMDTDAQTKASATVAQKQAAYDALRQLTPEQRKAKFLKEHKRKPEMLPLSAVKKSAASTLKTSGTTAIVPADARFPGEYEEVQAVFISWPYTWDAIPVIDTMLSSPSTPLYTKLADAIQKSNAKVHINVWDAADTAAVKACMALNGTPLFNYRFFVYEGDNIWVRDFGPVNYYYDADDKLGWVDFKYYPGRDLDNVLTQKWGAELGVPVSLSKVYQEGGNLLADGTQNLATTDAVYLQNSYYSGYTSGRTNDSLISNLALKRLDVLPALPHDGGTGHIDLYLDMTDENTFVFTKMPAAMSSVSGFTDYAIAGKNIDTLKTRKTFNGFGYYFYNIPFPTRDDGSWYVSAADYENYTRTYSNHLIVNKTIIQPIFSDALSGNAAGDAAAIDSIKKYYPGYNVIPIDMRYLDGSGGSIHCITKEMAADNPLRFIHSPYRGFVFYQSAYPLDAIITNKSGIASATVYWRIKGAATWKTISMTSASGNHWLANLSSAGVAPFDIIEYYISATSKNGKTMTRPMTGPDGPLQFWFENTSGMTEFLTKDVELGNLYPNPASDKVNLEVVMGNPTDITLNISDMTGKMIASQDYGTVSSTRYLSMPTSQLVPGIYMLNVFSGAEKIGTRRLIKK